MKRCHVCNLLVNAFYLVCLATSIVFLCISLAAEKLAEGARWVSEQMPLWND